MHEGRKTIEGVAFLRGPLLPSGELLKYPAIQRCGCHEVRPALQAQCLPKIVAEAQGGASSASARDREHAIDIDLA